MRVPFLTGVFAGAACCLAVAACSDGTGPNADVTGTYEAIVMRLEQGPETVDLLAAGAAMSIELKSNGTTTGALVIPGEYSESGDEETVSLAGTYVYDQADGTVTYTMAADSFVRDTTWEVEEDQLRGVFAGSDYTLTVVLQIAPGISTG